MSAAFHMAQRTGVILSGDYSAPLKIYTVPEDEWGITSNGTVWENNPETSLPWFDTYYIAYWPDDGWQKERRVSEKQMEVYKASTIGTRKTKEEAVQSAAGVLKRAGETAAKGMAAATKFGQDAVKFAAQAQAQALAGSSGGLKVPKGTWNDGAFTYEIKSPSEATVVETGVTFKSPNEPTEPRWQKFVSDLNAAYADKRLKEGKAPARSSGGGGGSSYVPTPVVSPAVVAPVATPFYKAKWFLPAVGVATLGVVLLIALWPSKKKKDDAPVVYLPAPPPVPVPVPAPQAV